MIDLNSIRKSWNLVTLKNHKTRYKLYIAKFILNDLISFLFAYNHIFTNFFTKHTNSKSSKS